MLDTDLSSLSRLVQARTRLPAQRSDKKGRWRRRSGFGFADFHVCVQSCKLYGRREVCMTEAAGWRARPSRVRSGRLMPMDGGGRVERRCAECSTCRHSDMHVSAMTWLAKLVVAAKCVLHLSGLHPLPCGVSFYFILKDSLLGSVPLWHTFVPQLVMCAPGAATLNLTACARWPVHHANLIHAESIACWASLM